MSSPARSARLLAALLDRTGMPGSWTETDRGRVHAVHAPGRGTLPPIVLLHGLASEGAHYALLMRNLQPHVQALVAPDLPGHGLSELTDRHADAEQMYLGIREALDQILGALPVRPILFGNSLGGLVATRYAADRPERIAGLLLCSPAGAPLPPVERDAFLASLRFAGLRQALAFMDRVMVGKPPFRLLAALGLRAQFSRPGVHRILDGARTDPGLDPDTLARLTMPVSLYWGQQERVLPPAAYGFFDRFLPAHAQRHQPDGVGHAPYLEDAPAVAEWLRAFAAQCAGSATTKQAI